MVVRVDRTIKSVHWAAGSFKPKAGQRDQVTFALRRSATTTLAIYRGSTLVRTIWAKRALTSGPYAWSWNGKASGAYVKPGTYRIVIEATSRIGISSFSRSVEVRAP
jgi:hypothetical protein